MCSNSLKGSWSCRGTQQLTSEWVHADIQATTVCVKAQLQCHILAQRCLRVNAVVALEPGVIRGCALLTQLSQERHQALADLEEQAYAPRQTQRWQWQEQQVGAQPGTAVVRAICKAAQ